MKALSLEILMHIQRDFKVTSLNFNGIKSPENKVQYLNTVRIKVFHVSQIKLQHKCRKRLGHYLQSQPTYTFIRTSLQIQLLRMEA